MIVTEKQHFHGKLQNPFTFAELNSSVAKKMKREKEDEEGPSVRDMIIHVFPRSIVSVEEKKRFLSFFNDSQPIVYILIGRKNRVQ